MFTGKNDLRRYYRKAEEPQHSVVDALDYDFAVYRYPQSDFRYQFIQKYTQYLRESQNITVYNCKLEPPKAESSFLNFYIYVFDNTASDIYYSDNKSNKFVKAFYHILDTEKLPAVSNNLRIQFIVRDVKKIMYSHSTELAWHDIHKSISDVFPEIISLSHWNVFYVFIEENKFEEVMKNQQKLNRIKEYCYQAAKKHDKDNVITPETFKIRVDNNKIFRVLGGHNYFNSDCMTECALI